MTEDQILYREVESGHYDTNAHVFGLDYYDRDSRGEDDFSRKLIWFYVYGDEDIEEELRERTSRLFDKIFGQDGEEWDLLTLYPTSTKGEVNSSLKSLFPGLAESNGMDYEQVFFRNRNIEENHEIDSVRKKVLNLEDSVDLTGDVEGKNVIVADNITLSGTSMLHATQELYEAGAENVACICLGLGVDDRENDTVIEEGTGASKIIEKSGEKPS